MSWRKQIIVDDQNYLLDFNVSSGAEQYSALFEQFVRGADAVVIVYSVHDKKSFEEVRAYWRRFWNAKQILATRGHVAIKCENVPVMVMAHDFDVDSNVRLQERRSHTISTQTGAAVARKLGCQFTEVCAETRDGLDEAFSNLARAVRAQIETESNDATLRLVSLTEMGDVVATRLEPKERVAVVSPRQLASSERKSCVVS